MRIRVYVRRELVKEITELEGGAENTGVAGIIPNKVHYSRFGLDLRLLLLFLHSSPQHFLAFSIFDTTP